MLTRLGDALVEQFRALARQDGLDPPLEQLARLPRTDTLQHAVDGIRSAIAAIPDGDPTADLARRRLGGQLERAERDLALGVRRDAIHDARPPGCWCLGLGGRGEAGVPVPTDQLDGDGRIVVEVVTCWREYCGCADGREASVRAAQAHARVERWQRAKRVEAAWSSARIPAQYADCTLESYPGDPTTAQILRDWLDTGRWLILFGEYGAGKTGLAVALLRELAGRGRSVLFVNAPAMLRRVRATFDRDGKEPSEQQVVRALAEVDVLAIDDVGKERLTEWGQELLYDIVNRRYSEGRLTILTTNLALRSDVDAESGRTDPGLEGHLGPATFWRFFERSLPLRVSGNLRLAGAGRGAPTR